MMTEPVFPISTGDGEALIAIAAFIAAVFVDYILWIYDRVKQILSLHHNKRDGT
ncbi:MAG: hypothetical protein VXW25_00380 [Pseudomonadota bacterium]|nr:hypothetical protein [Pseudomonadota bacterium]